MDANGLSSDLVQVETLRENGGRQIVKLRLWALPVIKDLEVFRDLLLRLLPTVGPPTMGQLALQRAQKRFNDVLSEQFPRLLMLGSRWLLLQKRCQASLPY